MIKLSIIIATYNRAEFLIRTLTSLKNQTLENSLFEIVVVNNNCKDNTSELFEEFAANNSTLNLKMVRETMQGLSHARNCGLAESKGEYIAIIDDDEEVNGGFAEGYYSFFEGHPDVAACGGKVVPLYEFPAPKWLSPYSERPIAGQLDLGSEIKPFTGKRYPGGGNMGIRRSAIEKYGSFNTELGRTGSSPMGGEEKELFERLRAGGEKIYYIPDSIIYHIIPEAKLTREYFERLSYMIGVSERVRTQSQGKKEYYKRIIDEDIKWYATLVLFVWYTIKLQPIKGWYLIKMRWNITLGLLNAE